MLVLGGVGIVLGVFAAVGAVAIALFLVVAALLVHNFWAVPEDQKQNEMTHFLKNVALAGGALALAVLALESWPYRIDLAAF